MSGGGDPIGILAGSGSLPIDGAKSIVEHGRRVYVVMVDGLADPVLKAYPHTVVNWAQVGRAMAAFRSAGVRDVVMLGATGRPSFRNARPDWGFMSALPAILRLLNAGGDDAVLRGLIGLFDRNGLNIVGVRDSVPALLIGPGTLTALAPSPRDAADISKGFSLIRALGRYDIGQAAVIINGRIAAIEGAEGTDRMLQYVATLRGADTSSTRSGVLVKRPKPGQDMRVDLPTVGPNTERYAAAAGLAGIAVMADHVLAAHRAEMVAAANAEGLFITGTPDEADVGSTRALSADHCSPIILTDRGLDPREQKELRKAIGILSTLTELQTGTALVIIENRVIVVGTDEPAPDVVARGESIRRPRRRKGLAAIGPRASIDDATVRAAHAANLAGIVIAHASPAASPAASVITLANTLGLFIGSVQFGETGDGNRG